MSRRRRDVAALVTLLALAGGCGGSDEKGATPSTVTVTTIASGWTAGDCDPAGRHGALIYRVCYSTPSDRGLELLRGGSVETVPVLDPAGAGVGHWRWAALSPDGETFVATWSAECEVPIAFTFPAAGGRPEPVAGEAEWTQAPASEALGWTADGKPIVRILRIACGKSAKEPGTYVVANGERTRVDDDLQPSLNARDVG